MISSFFLQGVQVAGLKKIHVQSPSDIMVSVTGGGDGTDSAMNARLHHFQGLLDEGNRRRKTESTDANAQSSRSHAVCRGWGGGEEWS